MATESVHEVQPLNVWRWTDDRVMIGSHLVQPRPGAPGVYFCFSQTRHAHCSMRQNFFHERRIEFSFEARCLFRIVPSQKNSLPFSPEVKARGHVDHHRKAPGQLIERFGGNELTAQRLYG